VIRLQSREEFLDDLDEFVVLRPKRAARGPLQELSVLTVKSAESIEPDEATNRAAMVIEPRMRRRLNELLLVFGTYLLAAFLFEDGAKRGDPAYRRVDARLPSSDRSRFLGLFSPLLGFLRGLLWRCSVGESHGDEILSHGVDDERSSFLATVQ
jgi:hypothetical protein